MTRTLVVELHIGPSGGKSTHAGDLYATLKRRNCDAEMAREWVKPWAREGREVKPLDELYVLGCQVHEEASLLGRVAVVVTDRPVLHSSIYAELYGTEAVRRGIFAAVRSYYEQAATDGHRRIAVLLPRRHIYQADGRFEDAAQARHVDTVIENMLGDAISGWWQRSASDYAPGPTSNFPGYIGLYKYSNDADFCDGADVAVDVTRWLAARK